MKRVATNKNQWKIEFSPAELDFIAANWQMPDKTFLAAFEKRFGAGLCFGFWRAYKYEHRLIKQKQVSWTPEQVQYLLDNYQKMGNRDIAKHFGWHNNAKKGEKKVWKKMTQMGLKRSWEDIATIFTAVGHSPKAEIAKRYAKEGKALGAVLQRQEGERWQSGKGIWMIKQGGEVHFLARFLWIEKHGSIPEGFMVGYYNGDHTDCRYENLCLFTWETMGRHISQFTSQGLSDGYIAAMMTNGNKELRKAIKQQPLLLEIKRQQLLNNRKIKSIQNGNTDRNHS